MPEDKKQVHHLQALRLTEHWATFEKLFNDRYRKHLTELAEATPEKVAKLQGHIAELKEIFNWFDYRIEESAIKLEGVRESSTNPEAEEY